jgi:hypothetical protein
MEKIELNKEWLKRLIILVDKLPENFDDQKELYSWITHLLGYVHSLDEYLK